MEEIYMKYSKQIYSYLLYLSNNRDLAEELTQETFYKAMKNINEFRGECKIDVWLCQIAKHLYYDEKSKIKKVVTINNLENLMDENIEEEIFDKEEKKFLYKSIEYLSPITREIILLRIKTDLSFRQIGEVIGKSENYTRVIFYRGKEQLKKLMDKYLNKEENYEK